MRSARTLAFVAIALLAGGIVSQLPSALGDDSENPLSALWDAIFDLQTRDEDLQAQIDELKVEGDTLALAGSDLVSDLHAVIEVEVPEDGRTLVHVTASNSGAERAAGVKVTAFYLMPLFAINSMDDRCEDKGRGIIECIIGTLDSGQESIITIDATARESGQVNTWTVDVSTTTDDSDYTNNHVTYNFETGSADQIEVGQPAEDEGAVEEPEVDPAPEQDDSTSNSTETEGSPSGNQTSTETGNESDEAAASNQTSTETEGTTDGSNSTSTETEEQESSGNQTSTEAPSEETEADEETVDDSSSNSTGTEGSDESTEGTTEESTSEEGSDAGTQEEQPAESETQEQAPEQSEEQPAEGGEESSGEEGSGGSGSEGGEQPPQ